MTTVTFLNGNQGVYGYVNMQGYDVEEATRTTYRAILAPERVGSNPLQFPASFELTIEGASVHRFTDGPDAGERVYTSGTITGITFFDVDGNVALSATDLSVELVPFAQLHAALRPGLWDFLVQEGGTFIGSNNASSPLTTQTGDSITTSAGDDIVRARGGNDFVSDEGGSDDYNGGRGAEDILSYEQWFFSPVGATQGIRADLAAGEVVGPDGNTDTVTNFEYIRGTFFNDVMLGDDGNNRFEGLAGRDRFDGRGGFDTVRYAQDAAGGGTDGIRANLETGRVRDGYGTVDRMTSIEGIVATDQRDRIYDSAAGNFIAAESGRDLIFLGGGDDYVQGGSDRDRFIFQGSNFGFDTIGDFEDGIDLIRIERVDRFRALDIFQDGDYAVVEWRGNQVRIESFDSADLDASDFIF